MRIKFLPLIEPLESRIAPASIAYVWDGSTSSDWFVSSNWTPDGVPGSIDSATLDFNSTINLPNSTSGRGLSPERWYLGLGA